MEAEGTKQNIEQQKQKTPRVSGVFFVLLVIYIIYIYLAIAEYMYD